MKTFRPIARALMASCLALNAALALAAPRAEALDLEDRDRAQVAKEVLKQKRDPSAQARAAKGCGNVDIGNDEDKRGSSRIAERQKTVIVTGNVYNTASCKR